MQVRGSARVAGILAFVLLAGAQDPAPEQSTVGTLYSRGVMTPTNQILAPSGRRMSFSTAVEDVVANPGHDQVAVVFDSETRLFDASGGFIRSLPLGLTSIMGAAFSPDGTKFAVTQIHSATDEGVAICSVDGTNPPKWLPVSDLRLDPAPSGIVFDPSGTILYVSMSRHNLVARVELNSGKTTGFVNVGVWPAGMVTANGRLFVANWGGRLPGASDPVFGAPVLSDSNGTAASGTVSVIDLQTFRVIAEIPVGLHPSRLALSPDGTLAAVANANSDSVSLIDTASLKVVQTLPVSAVLRSVPGASPTALTFDGSGNRLYVTLSGNNAVAVYERVGPVAVPRHPGFEQSGRQTERLFQARGMFATDWYPFAIAAATDTIFVANKKGLGSRAADGNGNYHSTGMTPTVDVIDSSAPFADAAVRSANTPFAAAAPRPGSPSTLASLGIQHVFLVIKENRTYDQVLGDLPVGNGTPQLVTYGAAATPNQHALASQFVVLDNFYASGTVSADGHQWLAQAMTSDYAERAATMRTPQYDADEVLSWVSSGFIWTNVREHGLTATIFGEMAQPAQPYTGSWSQYYGQLNAPQVTLPLGSVSFLPAFSSLVQPNYPGWALNIPDVLRARLFTERLNQYQVDGNLPNLIIVYLPNDHTAGTSPGFPTPAAMVADNDLATGRVIDAITKSSYWPSSAILVTEDDAQNGVDHVDGHRTLCFVVSPYARRGDLDSTQYNHTSVLRAIEELLGLPPMNKFDAAALPMRSAFTTVPNFTGFSARANTTALDTLNPAAAALRGSARRAALDSAKMDFSRPDAAPERKLNEILWHAARGWQTPYPAGPHRLTSKSDTD